MIVESGAADLSSLLVPTVTGALADPATQSAFNEAVGRALESQRVQSAARPYLMEASAWVAAGVLGAMLIGKRL